MRSAADRNRSRRKRLLGLVGRSSLAGFDAIDDVEIVIAGQDQNAFQQFWMRLQRVEQLRPLSGTACICQIARDQDDVDRLACVHLVKLVEEAAQTVVAARA